MAVERSRAARPPDMENFEIWIQGYYQPLVIGCSTDIRENGRGYRVYGKDGATTYIEMEGGMVSMNCLYDDDSKVLMDILTNQDPDTSAAMQAYYPQDDVFCHVVRLLKSDDEKRYIRAEFFPWWHTSLQNVNGAPGNYGEFTQDGQCDVPVAFQINGKTTDKGIAILTDVIPLSTAATYNGETGRFGTFNFYKPSMIPNEAKGYMGASKYALAVEIQRRATDDSLTDPRHQCETLRLRQNMVHVVETSALTASTITVASSSSGSLLAARYWYKVSATDANGETNTNAGVSIVDGSSNPIDNTAGTKNTVTIPRVTGAKRYHVYRAKGGTVAPTTLTSYGYLGSVEQPASGNASFLDKGEIAPDMLNNPQSTNTTGTGTGRVFIADNDLKGTGWAFADGMHYYAFVHYLYQYDVSGQDPYLVGDGLSYYARWQVPDGAGSITWP